MLLFRRCFKYNMIKMRDEIPYFTIKVNFAKAYDRIKYYFIYSLLKEVGRHRTIVNFIINCGTSLQTDVFWNGAGSNFFIPKCGIRPEDPMSPCLYVPCMYNLSHLIMMEVDNGACQLMKTYRNDPSISHHVFEGDVILFGQATTKNLTTVMSVLNLNKFCSLLGQQANHDKFSRNMDVEILN